MSIRAYGNNAAIELFEHHLVITRRKPGMIVDGPLAEHFLPYSSIKSVQFERPGFLSVGKIVFVAGNGSPKQGTLSDPHTVVFPKGQVRQFEDVLHTVRQAIATPSIERIAMAAAQNRGRIEQSAPPATAAHQEIVIVPPAAQREQGGQAYDHAENHDDRSFVSPSSERSGPINPRLGGWWSDMPIVGKIIAVVAGPFLLLALVTGGESDDAGVAPEESTLPEIIETGSASTVELASGKSFIDACYHYDSCGAFRIENRREIQTANGERLIKASLLYGKIPYEPGDDAPKGEPVWERRPSTYYALCSRIRPLIAFRAGAKWIAEAFDFTNSVPGAQQDNSQIYQALCHGYFQNELETNARALGYEAVPEGGRQFEIADPLNLMGGVASGNSGNAKSVQSDAVAGAEKAVPASGDKPEMPNRQPSDEELYAPHSN